jgi:PPK2 family polyphosphate:nucleotide phosphotransferase
MASDDTLESTSYPEFDSDFSPKFDIDELRVEPGKKPNLSKIDTRDTPFWDSDNKEGAQRYLTVLNERLEALQELLWAQGKERVLVVIQAMDAGGKDGTVRHVFEGVNPTGVKVASFKRPSSKELAHDYLWRVHRQVPGDGELTIFNRSHYEDVLVVRVEELVPKKRWERRYDHIVNFEQMLADEGTTIVKLFLHISKDEQKERLQARLDEPHKNWKFEAGDLVPRSKWEQYQEAFEDALARTSTDDAPWYIIPADRKWYRNIAVSQILIQTLERLEMSFPEAADGLDQIVIPD